jgi:cyclic beta-1,2-glucan synthetase
MYRLGIEGILGLKRKGNRLCIDPSIPDDWPGFEATYRDGDTTYNIYVHNPQGVNRGVVQITLDGEIVSSDYISLLNDGRRHDVKVELGR